MFSTKASKWAIRVVGSLLLIWALVRLFSPAVLLQGFERIPFAVFAGSTAAFIAIQFLSAWKWRALLTSLGHSFPWPRALELFFTGVLGNAFLPSMMGGDLVTVSLAFGDSTNRASLVVGSLLNRVNDTAGMLILGLAGSLWMLHTGGMAALVAGGSVGLLAACAAGWWLIRRAPLGWLPDRFQHLLGEIHAAMDFANENPAAVGLNLLLGVVAQAGLWGSWVWVGTACGLHMPAGVWLFAWAGAKVIAYLPVSMGGLGVRSLAFAALVKPFGVDAGLAASAGLVYQAVQTAGSMIPGVPAAICAARTNRVA